MIGIEILLAHLFGDYLLQDHWMASKKLKHWWPAIVHASIYTGCYVFLTRNVFALLMIGGTHLIIDRYRLINAWIRFKERRSVYFAANPPYVIFWLMVIQDNTVHVFLNWVALRYIANG